MSHPHRRDDLEVDRGDHGVQDEEQHEAAGPDADEDDPLQPERAGVWLVAKDETGVSP
jgi:hypothetical protein